MKDVYEFDIDEKLRPSVERKLTGSTKTDTEIAALELPKDNIIAKWLIIILRLYRRIIPTNIRNRCVFEPSCSHYSEAAIRKYGVISGCIKTIKRLGRCNPHNGGIDLP